MRARWLLWFLAACSSSAVQSDAAMPDGESRDAPTDAANFGPGPFTLSVTRTGGGVVEGSAGLSCDDSQRCVVTVAKGTQVTLTASSDAVSKFIGWTGDCTGTGPCVFEMTRDRVVAATFGSCPGATTSSTTIGGSGDDSLRAIAFASNGDAIVVGSFEHLVTLGAITLQAAGGLDAMVARIQPSGSVVWATGFGGSHDDIATGVVVDAAGDVFVTGAFSTRMQLGTTTLVSAGHDDVFVVKLGGSTGVPIWAKSFGAAYHDVGSAIAMTGSDVVVAGTFFGKMSVGATILSSRGLYDAFAIRLAGGNGTPTWATALGSTESDFGAALATDSNGDVLVTGSTWGNLVVGATTHTNAGASDVFAAKLGASDGVPVWSFAGGSSTEDEGRAIGVDGAGRVTVVGLHGAGASFGATVLTGSHNTFVARFDATGTPLAALTLGDGPNEPFGALVDGDGSVTMTGTLAVSQSVGNTRLGVGLGPFPTAAATPPNVQVGDLFVARVDSSGAVQWARRFGDRGDDRGLGLARGAAATLGLVGTFTTRIDLCSGIVPSHGGTDAFVLRLQATPIIPATTGGILEPELAPPLPVSSGPSTCVAPAPPGTPPIAAMTSPTFTEVAIAGGPTVAGDHDFRVTTGDLDGDGDLDGIILEQASNARGDFPGRVIALRNDGGTLVDATSTLLDETCELDSASSAISADFTGDHRADLLISESGLDQNPHPGAQSAFLGSQPDGMLHDSTSTALPRELLKSAPLAAADVDCDGDLDVAAPFFASASVQLVGARLLVNDGNGVFTREEGVRLPASALANPMTSAAFCDVDRDGAPDLVLAEPTGQTRDLLLMNDGHGFFHAAPSSAMPLKHYGDSDAEQILCIDYDLDGWPDLVEVVAMHFTPNLWITVMHNERDGTFADVTSSALIQTAESDAIAIADLNGDGWPDLVGSSGGCSPTPTHVEAQFFLNNGDGTFTETLAGVPGAAQGCSRIVPLTAALGTVADLLWVKLGAPTTLLHNNAH